MLRVTSLSRASTTQGRRKMPRTIELTNFEATGTRVSPQEAITQVSEMREQIEKNFENNWSEM